MTLSFVEKMLLRVWAILFSLAGIEVPIVFSRGGHLSAHCFLSLFCVILFGMLYFSHALLACFL
jgi:hypothetical protein